MSNSNDNTNNEKLTMAKQALREEDKAKLDLRQKELLESHQKRTHQYHNEEVEEVYEGDHNDYENDKSTDLEKTRIKKSGHEKVFFETASIDKSYTIKIPTTTLKKKSSDVGIQQPAEKKKDLSCDDMKNLDRLDFTCLSKKQKEVINMISKLWDSANETASMFEGPYEMQILGKQCLYIGMIDEKKTPVGFGKFFFVETKLYGESFWMDGKMADFVQLISQEGNTFLSWSKNPEISQLDNSKAFLIPYEKIMKLSKNDNVPYQILLEKYSHMISRKIFVDGSHIKSFMCYNGKCGNDKGIFKKMGFGMKFDSEFEFEMGDWNIDGRLRGDSWKVNYHQGKISEYLRTYSNEGRLVSCKKIF